MVEVVDGDTFQLASGKRVRLMGVDAPEYDRCGGKEARTKLSSLILNKYVFLTEEKRETFGRSLALTYFFDNFLPVLVNKIMLSEGWGRPDYRANSQRDILTAAFHMAKNEKKGIWSSLCRETSQTPQSPQAPLCPFKGNIDKNTYKKFYHFPGCRQYNQIVLEKDIGEKCFNTEGEAIKAGFVRSAGCPDRLLFSQTDIALDLPTNSYLICEDSKDSTNIISTSNSARLYMRTTSLNSCKDAEMMHSDVSIFQLDNSVFNSPGYIKSIKDSKRCFKTEEIPIPNIKSTALLININDWISLATKSAAKITQVTDCFPVTGGGNTELYLPLYNFPYVIGFNGDKKEILKIIKHFSIQETSSSSAAQGY